MRKYHFIRVLSLALFLMCSFSCSSDLNFDQANDLKLTPVIEGNLSYFDVPATAFVADDGSAYHWDSDDQNFDVFRDKYFNSYLQKADFHFEITNTISRAFLLSIVLLDDNSNALTTIAFDIPAYSASANNVVTRTEVFENVRLDLLKRARKMRFLVVMKSGTASNQNSTGNLVLRSSATVYLEI
ncbi:hypothetical protein [Flavobacterium sp. GSA192]|uniref:hypothetical protein n=1 Tax=Flavobacterium sp. GSA192 TaxID=2576304 RepID=UPI0011277A0B|nr:hypothetical protein [Flavobacterium sp. GSA192]